MLEKIGGLLLSLLIIFASADQVYKDWKQSSEPIRITVEDYLNSVYLDKSKVWVIFTDAKINLLDAVTVTSEAWGVSLGISRLYIPIKSANSTQNDTVRLLLDTQDAEFLDVARQLSAVPEAGLLGFLQKNRDKLGRVIN